MERNKRPIGVCLPFQGTTVGPAGATGASDVGGGGPRMEKFLSDDSNEFNGQRCHNNREQTEFSSEEEDDKSGRFLYPGKPCASMLINDRFIMTGCVLHIRS